MTEQDLLFSLDIGTRTVVGIVGFYDGQRFIIKAYEVEEHKERVMYDGQVHDIELVAKAVEKVKERLEEKTGLKLKRVSVAAAGRTLKTCKAIAEQDTDPSAEVERDLISNLEIEAVQNAQKKMAEQSEGEDQSFFCVGYAVVNYLLNGSIIGNLEGHKAKHISVEVLATFLPRLVVESLYAVVARVGLEVASLTLEPIAAMNVSISSSLKLLNLALVDIGAGTSDIALTKDGTVFAFAMASIAGDEITERISQFLLLGFDEAEKTKRKLNNQIVSYTDIMGLTYETSSSEVLNEIDSSIRSLAEEISNKILEFNGKSPSAVFLVGGGSQIPRLTGYIAEYLQIPAERVGVRSTDIIKDVAIESEELSGPEFITPIGIAVTSYFNRQRDFLNVTVNGLNVKMFYSKPLKIADSLIMMNYNPRNLIGRRGNSLRFKINGKEETVRGETGEPAVIYLNNYAAGLDRSITNGDVITVKSAAEGKPAEAYVRDYVSNYAEKTVYINEKPYNLNPVITINGSESNMDAAINNGDEVIIDYLDTVYGLMKYLDISYFDTEVVINGRKAGVNDTIKDGDQISYTAYDRTETSGSEKGDEKANYVNVTINGKPSVLMTNKYQCLFVDVFNNIEIDLKKINGINAMLLNGNKANFTDVINEGDKIELYWKEK